MNTIIEISLSNNETESDYKHFKKKSKGRTLTELFTDFMKTARIVVSLSALRNGRLYPRKFSWCSFPVRGWLDPKAIVRSEDFYVNEEFHWHLLVDNQWCVDVCTTGDTAHIDTIFKSFPHTSLNIRASIFFTAAMIRDFRSARSRGTNTLHEMHVAQ